MSQSQRAVVLESAQGLPSLPLDEQIIPHDTRSIDSWDSSISPTRSCPPWTNPTFRFSQASIPSIVGNQFTSTDLGSSGLRRRPETPPRSTLPIPSPRSTQTPAQNGDYSPSLASESGQSDFLTIKTIEHLGFGAPWPHRLHTQDSRESSRSDTTESDAEGLGNEASYQNIPDAAPWAITNSDLIDVDKKARSSQPWSQPCSHPSIEEFTRCLDDETELEQMTAEDIGDKLRNAYVESKHRSTDGYFVPDDKLHAILDSSVVRHLLRQSFPSETDQQLDIKTQEICSDQYISSRWRIFAILVLIGNVHYINDFIDNHISDSHLPLRQQKTHWKKTRRNPFLAREDRKDGPVRTCFSQWRPEHMDAFCRSQYEIMAPLLDIGCEKVYFYKMDDKVILPFLGWNRKISGGYGTVWKVKIHAAHHNFTCSQHAQAQFPYLSLGEYFSNGLEHNNNLFFAVKEIHSENYEGYRDEVRVLERFSGPNKGHLHLIRLLMAFQHGSKYYLLFPWANGNLVDMWKSTRLNPHDSQNVQWLMEQCLGIVDGLEKIHHHRSWHKDKGPGTSDTSETVWEKDRGTHGDIKPENILCFNSPGKPSHLVISDFGLTRFHSRNSVSNIAVELVGGFSRTYRPPEFDMHTPISRKYDIWSLGCLFLEFVTWFLLGYQATRGTFQDERLRDDNPTVPAFEDDKFFNLTPAPTGQGHYIASVKESVRNWINHLRGLDNCSDSVADFLYLIQKHLLVPVVDSRWKTDRIRCRLREIRDECLRREQYCVNRTHSSQPPENSTYAQPIVGQLREVSTLANVPEDPDLELSGDGEEDGIQLILDLMEKEGNVVNQTTFSSNRTPELTPENTKVSQAVGGHNERQTQLTTKHSQGLAQAEENYQLLGTPQAHHDNSRNVAPRSLPPFQGQETTLMNFDTLFSTQMSHEDRLSSATTTTPVMTAQNSNEGLRSLKYYEDPARHFCLGHATYDKEDRGSDLHHAGDGSFHGSQADQTQLVQQPSRSVQTQDPPICIPPAQTVPNEAFHDPPARPLLNGSNSGTECRYEGHTNKNADANVHEKPQPQREQKIKVRKAREYRRWIRESFCILRIRRT
ncbi:uncharacterized protein BCR38DRAFT_476674 [Pseudomassariella vexata]|uniref:Protein kinase domain-containing protein n=1 Tax=Pseudomassariella vexata TaxID=1141098 RepID=A0A1Y2DNC2_9PEZI|nr:uncharacterized protein BCR38DRAFT_476674 [Pseudomassariella vexata]ORY60793.1 hypothetical protein BCR38DRAFT_476674 [Pseudomassariella vexata]